MNTTSLVITLLSILSVVILIGLFLYIIEFRRVERLVSSQLVLSASLKEIQK